MFEGECARPAPSRLSQCRIVQPPIKAGHAVTLATRKWICNVKRLAMNRWFVNYDAYGNCDRHDPFRTCGIRLHLCEPITPLRPSNLTVDPCSEREPPC